MGPESKANAIRILAVDDHPLFRSGIAVLVATQPDMLLVAQGSNGREAIHQFRLHRPDITLMDLQMPEMTGLDAIVAIRGEFPEARIIVLTTYTGDVQVLRAMQVGARAYLLKSLLDKELLETIRAVHAGRKSLSPEASYELAEHATDELLTPAEVAVLRLIAAGNANKEIAAQLSVSEETVKGRVKSILSKLGANDRTHAAMIGIRRGIIEPQYLKVHAASDAFAQNSKESFFLPLLGLGRLPAITDAGSSCDDSSRPSLVVRRA